MIVEIIGFDDDDDDEEDVRATPITHPSCYVSSSLPLMSLSTKTLMLDFLGNFVVRGHSVGWRAGGVYSVGFN